MEKYLDKMKLLKKYIKEKNHEFINGNWNMVWTKYFN